MIAFRKLIFFIWAFPVVGKAFSLSFEAEFKVPMQSKSGVSVGGLSGAYLENEQTLWTISDDRGRFGDPRLIQFSLVKNKKDKLSLEWLKNIEIQDGGKGPVYFDGEGLAFFGDSLVVSSEGDNNSKPRKPPRLVELSRNGKFLGDIDLPSEFLPEATGEQKKGIYNNCGFEGLTRIDGERPTFLAMTETSLFQDQGSAARWLRYEKKDQKWMLQGQGTYPLSAKKEHPEGIEVFRGVAEVLHWKNDEFLVLERSAIFSKKGPKYAAEIYLWNERTSEKKILVDLKVDLIKNRGDKPVQNFEALAWGPEIEGQRRLLVISDNNFNKNESTEVLVFKVNP